MALRSFFEYLRAQGRRRKNPTAGISSRRPAVEAAEPYSRFQVRRLLNACPTLRDRALLIYALASGCRRSELLALRVEDINWSAGTILVPDGKGGKGRRVAPGRTALAMLRRWVGFRKEGSVWLNDAGRPITPHAAYKALRAIAQAAGVDGATFHRFRVTAADRYTDQGMSLDELQEVLGHSDIATTAHYAAYNRKKRALRRQRQLADRIVA